MFCAIAPMHAKAFRSAAHASLRFFRFGVLPASGCATWRGAMSQSGRLSYGSLPTTQLRPSATRHCLVGRPSIGGQRVETALQRSTSIRQNLWKSNQGSTAMHRPSIIANAQNACLFSPALAPVTCLTGRSSGRQHGPRLRHYLGPCWCPPVAALLAAPLN